MGRPVHFEIHAADTDRAQAFYEAVFGWTIARFDGPMDYRLITTGTASPGIDGAILERRGPAPEVGAPVSAFVVTVSVDDIAATEDAVKANGGTQVLDRMEIPNVGLLSYFSDTEGNIFGALQPEGAGT